LFLEGQLKKKNEGTWSEFNLMKKDVVMMKEKSDKSPSMNIKNISYLPVERICPCFTRSE